MNEPPNENKQIARCANCFFFLIGDTPASGLCRFNPPLLVAQKGELKLSTQQPSYKYVGHFPEMSVDGWCARWQPTFANYSHPDGHGGAVEYTPSKDKT